MFKHEKGKAWCCFNSRTYLDRFSAKNLKISKMKKSKFYKKVLVKDCNACPHLYTCPRACQLTEFCPALSAKQKAPAREFMKVHGGFCLQ